jgi:hypothetical protein
MAALAGIACATAMGDVIAEELATRGLGSFCASASEALSRIAALATIVVRIGFSHLLKQLLDLSLLRLWCGLAGVDQQRKRNQKT